MMEFLLIIGNMMPSTFMITSPILIAAIGGMICERAGVVNIALEGLMVMGAMTAAVAISQFGVSIPAALLLAAIVGGMFSLIHAFASVTLRADQVISGTGINLLSLGVTVFICQLLFGSDRSPNHGGMMRGFLGLFPVEWTSRATEWAYRSFGAEIELPGFLMLFPTVWIAIAILVLSWFVLYKRPWGLRLRAAGEHPQALASAGVNVIRIRYTAVLISGLLSGLAGGSVVLTQDIHFTVTTINGTGFIALAAVSFGRWLPLGILGSSFIFGMSTALAVHVANFPRLLQLLPSQFFNAMPFLITLITLIIFSGKDYAPRSVGKPFDKGKS
ncbi:MAG: ABC transporter permease [Treponema sp.]|nr:ABC transporter permease [Treponema sp.]